MKRRVRSFSEVFFLSESEILFGIYCPPHPQPLLSPEANDGYGKLREAFETCRKRIEESDADLILVWSILLLLDSDNSTGADSIKFTCIIE